MQFMNTFRLAVEEEEDALSKSSVWERVIFLCRWLPKPNEWRVLERPQPSLNPVDCEVVTVCWVFPLASVPCGGGGTRLRFIGGSLLRLLVNLSDGVRNKLRRLPVLLELELVLEGEEVWMPFPTPPEDGEEGRESCLLLALRRKMGRRETRVERRGPDSPI